MIPRHEPYKGFTLIELLVVISIISLLASVVLASLNTARLKGSIGAGKLQSSAIQHSLGDATVLQLDFDECAACGTAADTSGWNYNGTFSGATRTPATYNGTGYAASFNGAAGNYIAGPVGSGSALDIAGDVTVSAWIYPVTPTGGTIGSIVRIGAYADARYALYYNYTTQTIYFHWYDGAGFPIANATSNLVPLNRWSYAVVVRSGTKLSFYVNGTAAGTGTFTTAPVSAGQYNIGGAAGGTSAPYTGLIDEARVYGRDLSASEIKDIFLAQAARHGLVLK